MALHVGGRRKQVFQTPAFLGLIALNLVGSQLHSPFFTEAQGEGFICEVLILIVALICNQFWLNTLFSLKRAPGKFN